MTEDKKSSGAPTSEKPASPALGRRAAMVAIVFALVASAVFRWVVFGVWKGAPLEVVPTVSGQGTWCGKYYEPGQPPRTPGGNFPIPSPSSAPLLRFECWPSLRPYVSGLGTKGSILLSASAVNTTPGAAYSSFADGSLFHVTALLDGRVVASDVPLSIGTDNQTPAFDFVKAGIPPRRDAYNLTCSATAVKSGKVFRSGGSVQYLPPVPRDVGGVVQMDGRTGGLVAGQGKKRVAVLPFGFYTSFGGYLEKNVTVLDEIKDQGFNMVHPVPTFDNATALELVLDRMEELGLWSYKNLTAVRAEVEAVKKRKNLLAWYTADEPDGWEDALDAPQKAADIINELDGYRPVALALNCADYYFTEYTAHSQIILHDTYPVGINATWSTVWNTPCTPEVGDCGCDNCEGKMEDIAARVDAFRERLVWQGRAKEAVVWSVPQAFGPESYWARKPTSRELALEMLLAINHGSLCIMPWIDHPQDPLMRPGISPLAKVVPSLTPYILGGSSVVGRPTVSGAQRIDATTWTNDGKTLLITLNLNHASVQAQVLINSPYGKPNVVFENGAESTTSLPARPPGGNFPVPPASPSPLLRFECWSSLRPYVSGLDAAGSVLLSASVVTTTPGVAYSATADGSLFHVTAQLDGHTVASNVSLSIDIETQTPAFDWVKVGITPRRDAYNLTCSATSAKSGKVFHSSSSVYYLPPVPKDIGGVVQMDGRTGGLIGGQGEKSPVLPFGFYTSFDGYLDKNLTVLDEIKQQGFNLVHPSPVFGNTTGLELVLDRMEELGLWLIYDMRWDYKNLTEVRAQVEAIKKRKNLLAWYTADEPDGWGDALDAPQKAADLINELDGYRPIALVLNCADYYFTEYTAHSQIILQDTYPIGINATWSRVWDTPCTPEIGDCGCDNCEGKLEDIVVRTNTFRERLAWGGRARETAVWGVPQAFGPESYWPRRPSAEEIVLQSLLAINHGSLGIMPWSDHPGDPLMRPSISPLAKAFSALTPYILGGNSVVSRPRVSNAQRVDATTWADGDKTLLIALNLNNASAQAQILIDSPYSKPNVVFENGAEIGQGSNKMVEIEFQPLASMAVIF